MTKIDGENINNLIGYRGATINALQTLASTIANKHIIGKVRVILDVGGYREKEKSFRGFS